MGEEEAGAARLGLDADGGDSGYHTAQCRRFVVSASGDVSPPGDSGAPGFGRTSHPFYGAVGDSTTFLQHREQW